jgi:hypothetical protein
MNGGITLDVDRLSLKEVNAIIIAVENNHYSIYPVLTNYGEFKYFLKPIETNYGRARECELRMLLHKLAPDQFSICHDKNYTKKSQ